MNNRSPHEDEHDTPEVTKLGVFDIQVCVPDFWTDGQVRRYAESQAPCGTSNGWHIRKQGDPLLGGDNERAPCLLRAGFVHVMLDA